ncbi:MAG TPA: hypothetical protein VIL37_14290 [Natronosporangium sp.]
MQPNVFSLYQQPPISVGTIPSTVRIGGPEAVIDALKAIVDGLRDWANTAIQKLAELNGQTRALLGRGTAITLATLPVSPFGGLLALGGAAVAYYVRTHLDQIRAAIERVKELVRTILAKYSPVTSLIATSFKWIGEVMTPVTNIANRAGKPAAHAVDDWQGTAGSAYRQIRTEQKEAASQAANHASMISDLLYRVAAANIDYCLDAMNGVKEIALRIIETVGTAATVVGALESISKCAELVSQLVTVLFDRLFGYVRRLVDAVGDMLKLKIAMGNHEKFPGGRWPQAVTVPGR